MMARTGTDAPAARALLIVVLIGFALRAAAACLTIDIPGDGVSRANVAYRWSLKPSLIRSGTWPPGFNYLAGSLCRLIPNPRIAPRLLNVVLGSASIALLYVVSRRLYGGAVGLTAAALLAVLPLHVGLSASSLTEAAFVFGMLAVLVSAYAAADGAADDGWLRSLLGLAGVVCFGVLVEMLRYEAWLLLPPVVLYVVYRRRSLLEGIALAGALLCFPVQWSVENYFQTGNPILGFTEGVTGTEGRQPVSPFMTVRLLWRTVRNYFGAAAAMILVLAGLDAAIRVARRRTNAEQMLHIALAGIAWAIMFGLVLRRGPMTWGRLYILAFVLTLPLAAALIHRWVTDRRMHAAIAAVCLVCFAAAYAEHRPTMFVTPRRRPEIEALVAWRRGSIYRADAILLTRMNWEATYVPFYALDLAGRAIIVSPLEGDARLREFIRTQRPGLLVTRPEDADLLPRVEQLLGGPVDPQRLVKTVGVIQVFDIRDLTDPQRR